MNNLDAKIQEKLMAGAEIPFTFCEYDNKAGLSYDEIRHCGDEHDTSYELDTVDRVIKTVLKIPTRSEFHSADLDGDSRLTFKEWKTWAQGWDE